MNVKQIVKEWLEKNEYDGLCREECGCWINDLFACEGCNTCYDASECVPGYEAIGEYDGEMINGIWETKPDAEEEK